MKDYSDINLNAQLRKLGGISAEERKRVTDYDFGVNYHVPTGGLSYSQLNVASRPYTAIVSKNKKQGSFDNIQAAINYVKDLGGGSIFVKNGTYTLTADILMKSNVELVGEDNVSTIIDCNNTVYKIYFNGKFNASIKNFKISNCDDLAVHILDSGHCVVENIVFEHNGKDLGLYGSSYRCRASNIYSSSSQVASIVVEVSYSDICTNEYSNIFINGGLGFGVNFLSGFRQRFINITVDSVGYSGFNIDSPDTDRSYFQGCEARDCDGSGFRLIEAERLRFVNCAAYSNADHGFSVAAVNLTSFIACSSLDNGAWGFALTPTSGDCIVVGNVVKYNTSGGIEDLGSNNVVANNTP